MTVRILGSVFYGWFKLLKKYCHNRLVLLLVVSLCVVFTLYTVTDSKDELDLPKVLGPAYSLLRGAHVETIKELNDLSENAQSQLVKAVQKHVLNWAHELHQKNKSRKICVEKLKAGQKILTLFTTWVYDKDKFSINNKTLYNWKTLPHVNLLVFSSDDNVKQYSQMAGWTVIQTFKEADNAPMLSAMFKEAMGKFDSMFYGYANGDLLFTDNLIDSMQQLVCKLSTDQLSESILVVGKRTNVPANKITPITAVTWNNLYQLAEKEGELFQPNALDYFITNRQFPWHLMLPLVVGRRGYDNWMVAYSLYNNILVIDATETVLCVHQTLETRGNYEGLTKGNYNMELIADLNLPFSFSKWGETACAWWRTWYNLAGTFILDQRKLKNSCTEYFWMYKFWKMLGLEASDDMYNISKSHLLHSH